MREIVLFGIPFIELPPTGGLHGRRNRSYPAPRVDTITFDPPAFFFLSATSSRLALTISVSPMPCGAKGATTRHLVRSGTRANDSFQPSPNNPSLRALANIRLYARNVTDWLIPGRLPALPWHWRTRKCCEIRPSVKNRPDLTYAATSCFCLINASRSALIVSAWVVGIPCGKPGYTLRVAPFTSFEDCRADAAIGTIW